MPQEGQNKQWACHSPPQRPQRKYRLRSIPRTSANVGHAPQTGQYPSTQLADLRETHRRLHAWRKGTGASAAIAWRAAGSGEQTAATAEIGARSLHYAAM